jgi:hypothetical protein
MGSAIDHDALLVPACASPDGPVESRISSVFWSDLGRKPPEEPNNYSGDMTRRLATPTMQFS